MSVAPEDAERNPDGTFVNAASIDRSEETKNWTNWFDKGTDLYKLYERRVSQDQDIVAIWDDYHQRRGTGKTVGCIQLAAALDRTDEGLTKEKVFIEPKELLNAYHEQPLGSALVMDEAEIGASNRQAMTSVNKAIREIVSTGRVEEKYVVLNAPSWQFVDLHLRSMATLWITTLYKGLAQVHFVENDPYKNRRLTPKKGLFKWKDIAHDSRLRDIYDYLTEEKKQHIRGERGETLMSESEHQEELKKATEEARREARNNLLRRITALDRWDGDGDLRLGDLGAAAELSQSQVSRIVNEDPE